MIAQNELTMLEDALAYAQIGFRVFPTHGIRNRACTCGGAKGCSPGKHPIGSLVPRGVLEASADLNVVKRWWDQVRDANIGVATGKDSDLVVLDVDGPSGEETLAEIQRKHGLLPPTWQVKTGKGRHLYFRYPKNVRKVKSVARKKLGLDIRADGDYVIAPSSLHVSGQRYVFDADSIDNELADCPEWVVAYANGELKIDGPAIGTANDLHTDLGNARRFIKRHGKSVRFIPEWRKWIVWNGSCWDIDNDGAAMRLAKDTVEAMYEGASKLASNAQRDALLKHAIRSQAEARLKAMVSLAESEGSAVLAAHKLDADPWLLGVLNGVIELKTGQFRPARQEDLITKRANVAFELQAQCPEWQKFLGTVTGGDADLQSYIQRAVGYTLTGSVREEVLFVLYGTGSNGKSTFRETLHALFGDYALAADASLLTERKKAGGATEEIARLKGRRFVAVNETAENDQLNEARVKFITSQDMISARNLYGHLFDFFPSHKSFLTTNHKPVVRGTDEGIWRRVQLIPFIVTIDKSELEKDFRERRLMPELPGILNWALDGLAAYRKQGLNPPVTVLASTQEYREDMDVVGQWIAERCVVDPKAIVPTGTAYFDYSQWANDELGWELKKPRFRRQLSDRGFAAVKGAHGQRMIQGLRLKSTGASAQTAADIGEQTEADAAVKERIKKLLANSLRSGDLPDAA